MSWILGGVYCGVIWLVFAKLKLVRLSLPLAILLASVGPSLIVALLLCAQYLHPYTPTAIVLERIDPITPQLSRSGRVLEIMARPNEMIRKGDTLFTIDPVPYENAVRRGETGLEQATQNVDLANSSVALAEAVAQRAESDLEYAKNNRDRQQELRESGGASQDELERSITLFRQAVATMTQAEESLTQAKLSVDVAKTKVTEASVAVENAQYDLLQTTVLAPSDGYVTNLQLREGMMVGGGGTSAVMTFIREPDQENKGVVLATFAEKNFLRIKSGQYAEVALDGYPGQILTGRVLNVIDASGTGQLTASGTLPSTVISGQPTMFAVRIRLDDGETIRLPGGAQGIAAIYTENIQVAGIPIMFLIRANSWLNYLK
ncbi:Multidrug resistance efflux pump [Neorhodopirellula lusitana]|uniref:Multidrug resistance efflux pump n=1 Tax=Neorhodopirellula lusitana TaxID=445327 RepID=A0ABY1PUY1_9BACT|nr:HlyD family secretion protein [Neorhodopirellula lusitana]SMP42617.1 Multidrug resistance efflux pump [Neorhodopirellula lusitana]